MPGVEQAYQKLQLAVRRSLSWATCLRRWSEFIRIRDGFRCINCHQEADLAAHHICRKIFLPAAHLDTGNGITLCYPCHKEVHKFFNKKPNFELPVDYEDGEKLAIMEKFYSALLDDAISRNAYESRYYFLGDDVLDFFARMQGYSRVNLKCGRLEQAFLLLSEPEWAVRNAIAAANGFKIGEDQLLPGGMAVVYEGDNEWTVSQAYRPRSSI